MPLGPFGIVLLESAPDDSTGMTFEKAGHGDAFVELEKSFPSIGKDVPVLERTESPDVVQGNLLVRIFLVFQISVLLVGLVPEITPYLCGSVR